MVIELPKELEVVLKAKADTLGVSPIGYALEILERELAPSAEADSKGAPFKTSRGMWAKYGVSLSAEDIDENRADMFRNFGEDF